MKFVESVQLVAKVLSAVKWEKQMCLVLEDLFTPQEIVDLSDRILVLQEIKSWKKQRDIAEELWISVTTVNRGSRVMKFGSGEIGKVI
jgi:Trp operon repressor